MLRHERGESTGTTCTPVNSMHPEILKMTPEEREQMNTLCARIAVEKERTMFDQLVRQLNDL
jgi:hypothetical protein